MIVSPPALTCLSRIRSVPDRFARASSTAPCMVGDSITKICITWLRHSLPLTGPSGAYSWGAIFSVCFWVGESWTF